MTSQLSSSAPVTYVPPHSNAIRVMLPPAATLDALFDGLSTFFGDLSQLNAVQHMRGSNFQGGSSQGSGHQPSSPFCGRRCCSDQAPRKSSCQCHCVVPLPVSPRRTYPTGTQPSWKAPSPREIVSPHLHWPLHRHSRGADGNVRSQMHS